MHQINQWLLFYRESTAQSQIRKRDDFCYSSVQHKHCSPSNARVCPTDLSGGTTLVPSSTRLAQQVNYNSLSGSYFPLLEINPVKYFSELTSLDWISIFLLNP